MEFIVPTLLLLAMILLAWKVWTLYTCVTILEYQQGLEYRQGRFTRTLAPGRYRVRPSAVHISVVDMRERVTSVPGQEVLSRDGITLKVSLASSYRIADPVRALHVVEDCEAALYQKMQTTLRHIIGSKDMDEVLALRQEMAAPLLKACRERAEEIGLEIISLDIKDIMFPGALKELYAKEIAARKEGLAALERARGETAALRKLANASRMLEDNRSLLTLRILQTLENSTGNTVILDVSGQDNGKLAAAINDKTGRS